MSAPALRSMAHALGWTLLHFCWQGALIGILLTCILSLSNARSAKIRYVACCLALLMNICMPVLTYVRLVTASHADAKTILLFPTPNQGLKAPRMAPLSAPLLSRLLGSFDRAVPSVLTVWFAGVTVILLRLGTGVAVAHRVRSTATAPLPREVQVIFNHLLSQLDVTRPVKLLASALVQVPTLIGWGRPVILLPLSCLSGLSMAQLEAILVHELAHIRRHDYLINVLQSVVEALLFFHPAVWWVSRRIRRERENCCDDMAVGFTGDVLNYARALSLLEEHRSKLPQPILQATGGVLVTRIKRLLGMEEKPGFPHFAALATLALIVIGAGIGVSTFARAQTRITAQAPSANVVPAQKNEYRTWLDEDVRWNITAGEQTVFLHLSSDAERDDFIQQFWLRRDVAGAPPNSARAEHYKRIAYSNQHFAGAGPGWASDRGRIYILYGPPSSIDAHPVTTSSTSPYEVWNYDNALELGHRVELRFVDTCKCGDYELLQEPDPNPTIAGRPDKVLYEKGVAQIDEGKYEKARMSLQTLINAYPSSPFAKSAQLAIATSWDQQGDPAAIHQADDAYEQANVTPVRIGGSVSAPVLTLQADPEYSASARAAKEQGTVVIGLWVDDQGRPSHVRVIRGVAKDLDDKAQEAVRKYGFKPALQDGAPVLVAINIDVNFAIF